jgi:hypothetical protein
MKVADMTVEELADLIRRIVAEELECLRDEDEGEVRPEFLAEIEESMASGEAGVALTEVVRELRLKV